MVDLPTVKDVPLTTIQAPQERVSPGDVQRSGGALASGMAEIGQGLGDLAVPLAERQAASDLANQKVALDENGTPTVLHPANSFIMGKAGDAYAHAVLAGTAAQMDNTFTQHAVDLHQQSMGDPEKFKTAWGAYSEAALANLSGPARQAAAQALGQLGAQHTDGLVEQKGAIDRDMAKGSVLANINNQTNALIALARQPGGTSAPEFVQARDKLMANYDALGDNPLFKVPKDKVEIQKRQALALFDAEATVSHVDATYDRSGRAAAQKELEGLLGDPNLEESARLRLYRMGMSHLQYKTDDQRAAQDANKQTVELAEHNLASGKIKPTDPNLDTILDHSLAIGDSEGVARIRAARDMASLGETTRPLNGQQELNAYGITPGIAGPRDLMIRTIYGEAGGESDTGKAAVAHVIRNRLGAGTYGKDVTSVINAPQQFSLWNPGDRAGAMARQLSPDSPAYKRIGEIVDGVMNNTIPDPTGGATHYYNPHAASPIWGDKLGQENDVTIGNHRFVGRVNPDTFAKNLLPPTDPQSPTSLGTGKMTYWEREHGYGTKPPPGYVPPDGSGPAAPGVAGRPAFTADQLRANPFLGSAYLRTMAENPADREATGRDIANSVLKAVEGGNMPRAQDYAQALQLTSESPKLADLHDKLSGYLEGNQLAVNMPGSAGREFVEATKALAEGQDIHTINQAQARQDQFNRRETALAEHPFQEAATRGWIPQMPAPLDPSKPGDFAAAIAQRGMLAGMIGSHIPGADAQSIFDKSEVPIIKNIIANGTADQKLGLLDPLSKLPDPVRKASFAAIGDGKDGAVFSVAGHVSSIGHPEVGADILQGMALLKSEPRLAPKAEDLEVMRQETLPAVAFPAGLRDSVTEAARALYAKAAADAGDTGQVKNQDRWNDAVNKVTGGVVDYRGSKIIVPTYGQTDDQFAGLMSKLTDADLSDTRLSNGQPLTAAALQPRWGENSTGFRLQSVGDGKYAIFSGTELSRNYVMQRQEGPDAPTRTRGPEGSPFILDLTGRTAVGNPPVAPFHQPPDPTAGTPMTEFRARRSAIRNATSTSSLLGSQFGPDAGPAASPPPDLRPPSVRAPIDRNPGSDPDNPFAGNPTTFNSGF